VTQTHIVEANTRPRFVEIMKKLKSSHHTIFNPPTLIPCTSGIGTCIEALPIHVQIYVGDIPTLTTPTLWDLTTPVDMFIATDGPMTFGVGYHRWVIAMADEDILIQGGGPDDGDLCLMASYRSGLGVLTVGLAVIGTMASST
jgi:hypothetical protein